MKKTLTLLAAFLFITANAQVGVNTDDPQTSLHVVSSPDDAALADGITAPRLTGQQLKSKDALYQEAETSALVYVTEPLVYDDPNVTEDPAIDPAIATTTKTQLVTSIGYYYFDGTLWRPMPVEPWNIATTTDKATGVDQDIYHKGKVAIGADFPGSAGQLAVRTSDPQRQLIQGIALSFGDDIPSTSYAGLQMIIIDQSTGISPTQDGSISSMSAVRYTLQDKAPNVIRGLEGISSDVSLGVSRNAPQQTAYGFNSSLDATASTAGLVMEALGGFNNRVDLYGNGGTFDEAFAIKNTLHILPTNGSTSNIDIMANVWANSGFAGATNGGTEVNDGATINVNKVYGVLVEAEPTNFEARKANIGESYGIYIGDYNFNLTDTADPANAYNFFSEGEGNKNVFEGRVGVGTNAPAAKVHIIKEADASVLTPIIIENLPEYTDSTDADNALPTGGLYKDGSGFLKVAN